MSSFCSCDITPELCRKCYLYFSEFIFSFITSNIRFESYTITLTRLLTFLEMISHILTSVIHSRNAKCFGKFYTEGDISNQTELPFNFTSLIVTVKTLCSCSLISVWGGGMFCFALPNQQTVVMEMLTHNRRYFSLTYYNLNCYPFFMHVLIFASIFLKLYLLYLQTRDVLYTTSCSQKVQPALKGFKLHSL